MQQEIEGRNVEGMKCRRYEMQKVCYLEGMKWRRYEMQKD